MFIVTLRKLTLTKSAYYELFADLVNVSTEVKIHMVSSKSTGTSLNAHVFFNSYDFNAYRRTGFYRINEISDYTNAPNGVNVNYGQLIVSKVGDTCLQIYCGFASGHVFFRCFSDELIPDHTAWWKLDGVLVG